MNLSLFNSKEKKDFAKIKNLINQWKLENTVFKTKILLKMCLAYKIGELVFETFFIRNSDEEDYGTNSEDSHIGYDSEDFRYDDTDWYLEERFTA